MGKAQAKIKRTGKKTKPIAKMFDMYSEGSSIIRHKEREVIKIKGKPLITKSERNELLRSLNSGNEMELNLSVGNSR